MLFAKRAYIHERASEGPCRKADNAEGGERGWDAHDSTHIRKPDMMITFTLVKGKPPTFEVRGENDTLEFTGRRQP